MFGFDQRNHADSSLVRYTADLVEMDKDLEKERQINRKTALKATEAVRQYNKMYSDTHHKKPSIYNVGDYVLIRNLQMKPGSNAKLKPKYKGPYQIAKSLGSNRYVVRDVPGFNLAARPLNTILSADKLKPWVKLGPVNN